MKAVETGVLPLKHVAVLMWDKTFMQQRAFSVQQV